MPVRILIVDDHKMVRDTIRSSLISAHDFAVVGEASDGEEALKAVQQLMADVVIMDINMPRMNGIEATRLIKRSCPHMVVIGLSLNTGDDYRHAMKAAGAYCLLSKDEASQQLQSTIRQAVQGS